jgi:hypothetical protein
MPRGELARTNHAALEENIERLNDAPEDGSKINVVAILMFARWCSTDNVFRPMLTLHS